MLRQESLFAQKGKSLKPKEVEKFDQSHTAKGGDLNSGLLILGAHAYP